MPFTYLPSAMHLRINDDKEIELILHGEVIVTMTPEEARSNATDLLEAATRAEGKAAAEVEDLAAGLRAQILHTGNEEDLHLVYRSLLVLLEGRQKPPQPPPSQPPWPPLPLAGLPRV